MADWLIEPLKNASPRITDATPSNTSRRQLKPFWSPPGFRFGFCGGGVEFGESDMIGKNREQPRCLGLQENAESVPEQGRIAEGGEMQTPFLRGFRRLSRGGSRFCGAAAGLAGGAWVWLDRGCGATDAAEGTPA